MQVLKYNMPDVKTWLEVHTLFFFRGINGLVGFIFTCTKHISKFGVWCSEQMIEHNNYNGEVINNSAYGGVPVYETERLANLVRTENEWLQEKELQLFDFGEFKNYPNKYPHIRLIAQTGGGKTTTTEWLLNQLGGEQFVITPYRKSGEWVDKQVFGHPFNFAEIEDKINWVYSLMYKRYEEIDRGIALEQINFVLDDWTNINREIGKAKETVRKIITISRKANMRLIAIAHGESAESWGFKGESDLKENFTTIRLGNFATDHCQRQLNRTRRDSSEYNYYSKVMAELKRQGDYCCMVDNSPAQIPYIQKPASDQTHRPKQNTQDIPPSTRKIAPNVSVYTSTAEETNFSQADTFKDYSQNQNYNGLNQYENTIIGWGRDNRGKILTARDLQSSTRLFKSTSAEQIRNIFQALASRNLGAVTGVGAKLGWLFY